MKIITKTIFLLLTFNSFGQNVRENEVKHDFTQIDSLIDDKIESLEYNSILIVHTVWNVGAHRFEKSDRLIYDNPFYILFYCQKDGKEYLKKNNNLGESKLKKGHGLNQNFGFVDDTFDKMTTEILKERPDTTYYDDGTNSVTYSIKSHQQIDRFLIIHGDKEFKFTVRQSYTENKLNYNKRQFQFFLLLGKSSDKWNQKIKVE